MKLRIGHLSTFYHTAVLMMAHPELLSKADIRPEWKLFGTGPALVRAFEYGEIDLAYIGLPPAIIGIDRGVPLKCIAGGHIEGTVGCAGHQYKGYPELEDIGTVLQQFRGLKIGVPGRGSIHDVILRDCLRRCGLYEAVDVVNFQWADLVTEAIVHDEVAAAFGTPALAVAVRRFADGKIIYPPSLLWPHNPSYGIVVNLSLLKSENQLVEQFLLCHEEATSFLRNRPGEAAKLISHYTGVVDESFVFETIGVSPKYCAQITSRYIDSTIEFVKALRSLGYIKRSLRAEEIFDTAFINKIHPEKDHYSAAGHEHKT